MKKMNAPVMETVRFTEDDVIVASGAGNDNKSIFISNFGNTTTGDGSIKYNGTEYSGSMLKAVSQDLNKQLGDADPYLGNPESGAGYSLNTFIASDLGFFAPTDNEVGSDMNGSYDWNGYMFVKR